VASGQADGTVCAGDGVALHTNTCSHDESPMRLLQALRNQSAKIRADLENSKLFTQMGDRGTFRESIIREFLRPFLPDCYGLSSGEVFSSDGSQSAQVDIVIYDAVFSTVLFRDGPNQLFPAESVFGSIEVKSRLSTAELAAACHNIESVKALSRANADSLDLLPTLRLELGPGLTCATDKRNPYLGIVFAYEGLEPMTIANDLSRRSRENTINRLSLPDFVFVAKPGYMIARYVDRDGKHCVTAPGNEYKDYLALPTGDDTLPLFFLTVNACLAQLRLRALDFSAVWNHLFFDLHKRAWESAQTASSPQIPES
jgi:hypothetical protein